MHCLIKWKAGRSEVLVRGRVEDVIVFVGFMLFHSWKETNQLKHFRISSIRTVAV